MKIVMLKAAEFRAWTKGPVERQAVIDSYVMIHKDVLFRAPGSSRVLKVVRSTPLPDPKVTIRATSPDVCQCREYAGTEPGKHHPACIHRAPWEAQENADVLVAKAEAAAQVAAQSPPDLETAKTDPPPPPEESWWLVTEHGEPVRPALDFEVEQAEASAQEVGVRMVILEDTIYHLEKRHA